MNHSKLRLKVLNKEVDKMAKEVKDLAIRNSTAELFDKGRSTITEHLSAIYAEGGLDKNPTCRNFRHIASCWRELGGWGEWEEGG